MLLKVLAIGISTVIINLILKQYKPEFATLVNICGGLLIFVLVVDGAKNIVNNMINMAGLKNLNVDIISPILKILGVGYITEFTANIAEDSGNKTIATKVLLGGKIAICVVALPIIESLINAILSLI